jgi:peptidyl-prolyl cis-trans isomerase C
MRAARAVAAVLAVLGVACRRDAVPKTAPPPTLTEAELAKPLPSPIPDPVAVVNGQPITLRKVALAARQGAGPDAISEEQRPRRLRDAMYKLITRELLFQEATARGVAPDERAIEQAYNEARLPFRDDAAWAQALSEQGFDPQSFRQELRVQHTVGALLAQEGAKIPDPTEEEALLYYRANPTRFDSGERVKLAHILLRVPKEANSAIRVELRLKAEALLGELRKGADFAALAKKHSADPASSAKGGELAPLARGQMPKSFEDAAFALAPGELSGVVETPFGYHVLKLIERVPSTRYPFEAVRDEVRKRLGEERRHKNLETLVGALRAKARIETYL